MADDDAVARGKEAAAVHDQWNVGVVTLLVALTFYCFVLPSPFAEAALNYSVLIYMLCDIAYHLAVPHCQPTVLRSVTIMLHHAATLLLVLHPISYPAHASWTRHAMLVEVNTVLHNANKVYKKPLVAAGFYLTWFGLRLGTAPICCAYSTRRSEPWGLRLGSSTTFARSAHMPSSAHSTTFGHSRWATRCCCPRSPNKGSLSMGAPFPGARGRG